MANNNKQTFNIFSSKSSLYSSDELEVLRNTYDLTGTRSILLGFDTVHMSIEMFSDVSDGNLLNSYPDWDEAEMKKINNLLNEFFLLFARVWRLKKCKDIRQLPKKPTTSF